MFAISTVRWSVGFSNLLSFRFNCLNVHYLNVLSYLKAA